METIEKFLEMIEEIGKSDVGQWIQQKTNINIDPFEYYIYLKGDLNVIYPPINENDQKFIIDNIEDYRSWIRENGILMDMEKKTCLEIRHIDPVTEDTSREIIVALEQHPKAEIVVYGTTYEMTSVVNPRIGLMGLAPNDEARVLFLNEKDVSAIEDLHALLQQMQDQHRS